MHTNPILLEMLVKERQAELLAEADAYRTSALLRRNYPSMRKRFYDHMMVFFADLFITLGTAMKKGRVINGE